MSNRMLRADGEIAKALSTIISTKLRDPRLSSLITVTKVKTSPDFRYSKVGVSPLSDSEEERRLTVKLLQKSSGFIKKELADMLDMPHVPELRFELDEGAAYSEKINKILENLDIPEVEDEEDDF